MAFLYLLLNGLLVGWLIYSLWRRQTQPFLKLVFWPALLFKLIGGILVGWLYQYYNKGGDTFEYQQQAEILSHYAQVNFRNYLHFLLTGEYESVYLYDVMKYRGYSNSFFMVWLLHFLNFITGYSYYLNSLYFSLFSFYGCWRLTATIAGIFSVTKAAAALAFLFFPSVVFWSSGVLKESILLGSTTLLLAQVLQIVYLPRPRFMRSGLLILVAAYVCFKIRFYFAVAYFPLLAGFAVLELATRRWIIWQRYKLGIYLITIPVLGFLASFLHEAINANYFFQELIKSYYSSRVSTTQVVFNDLANLQPTFQSLFYYAPQAISNVIFRPYLGEVNSLVYILAGGENLLVLLLVIIGICTVRINKSVLPATLVLSLGIYGLLLAALIGFSTANLGSISRYKAAFMPFFMYLILQTGVNQTMMVTLEKWLIRKKKY